MGLISVKSKADAIMTLNLTFNLVAAITGGLLVFAHYIIAQQHYIKHSGLDYIKYVGLGLVLLGAVLQYTSKVIHNEVANKNVDKVTKTGFDRKELNIVVVGAGLIGPRHAQHVSQNPRTKLFGIIDLNPNTREVADNLNTRHFQSVETMIRFCDSQGVKYPDGAIVCTPNHTHVHISAQLASHGINLLIEKPLSPTPEESKALKIYTTTSKVKVLVGHHRRFNPFILAAKRHLSKVGKVVAVQGSWTLKKDDPYFKISPWRTDSATGGGALLINLVHDLDLLQYLFGPIQQVYAELLPQQREYTNVDEGAALTLRFKSGACGTFICSDNVVSPYNFESCTGENPTIPYNEDVSGLYRVFGSKGTLSIPDFKLYQNKTTETSHWLNIIKHVKLADKRKLRTQKPFDAQLDHFVDVINETTIPNCSIDDGISAMLAIQAVQKSIQTGTPQPVLGITDIRPDYNALRVNLDKKENV